MPHSLSAMTTFTPSERIVFSSTLLVRRRGRPGESFDDRERAGAGHAADDLFDVLDVGAVAEQVELGAGVLLVAGHRGGAVLQDDEGDVLPGLDRRW